MRILVTGASGFVGRWVVMGLVTRGHDVIAVSHGNGLSLAPDSQQISWRSVDLLNQFQIDALIASERPAGLVHCAWETTPNAYWSSPENLPWVSSSLQLMESFRRYGGQRAVIAGTSAEYDWSSDQTLHEDRSATVPTTMYGISKNALRQILQHWAKSEGVSLAWGRIFCPFGPGENSTRLVPRLIQGLSSGTPLPFDSGNLIRDFLSVEDLGDAFAAVFDSDFEGTVNVASGRDTSIAELVTVIAKCMGTRQVNFGVLPDPVDQPRRLVADVTRLAETVGWTPACSIEKRISEICHPLRSHAATTAPRNR